MALTLQDTEALLGCVLGTATGDAIGLPFENLSRKDVARLAPQPLEHSFLGRRGLASDDTDHTMLVVLALADAAEDLDAFERRLAARLRWWLLALPPFTGSATARAVIKSWLGFGPRHSGVRSAGTGPAMRAAPIGVAFARRPTMLRKFVLASTRITHTDPRAFDAALAVAVAAGCASRLRARTPAAALDEFACDYREAADRADAFATQLRRLEAAVRADMSVAEFARRLGCADAVTGFALHSVPVAIYAWLRYGDDFREAVTQVVSCGGNTDSTAAITGAIVGAGLGESGIPASWLAGLLEWSRTMDWIRDRCAELASGRASRHSLLRERVRLPLNLVRNLTTLGVVLLVTARRRARLALRH